MITRDRFEKIMDAIASGTAISNARNRFELICSAIAEAIGSAGGGGTTVTREVIGEYDSPSSQYTYIETTKSMSDYDYLEIEFEVAIQYSSVTHTIRNCEIAHYAEGKSGRTILSTSSSSAGLSPIVWDYTNSTKISIVYGYGNSLNIKKITGVKFTDGE